MKHITHWIAGKPWDAKPERSDNLRAMRARSMALLGLFGLFGCGGDDGGGGMTDDVLDPPPPEGGQQLTTTEYTLEPGEEKYLCWTWDSPSDGERAITEIVPIAGPVVHHIVLVKTRQREAEAHFECNELLSTNWEPIWASGAGSNTLTMPEGVGFKVQPGSQYLVQLHLLNSSEGTVSERMGINLRYAPDAGAIIPAGFYPQGSFQTRIPAEETEYTQTIECPVDREMNVFAVFPHMHKIGRRMTVEAGATSDSMEMMYMIDPWAFGDQPFDLVDFRVTSGTRVKTSCTWLNDTGAEVTFGESTFNEMCFSMLFYYPFSDLVLCIDP